MRKEIKYTLPYRQEGEDKEIVLKIDFISYRILREYSENQSEAVKANAANNQMAYLEEEIAIERMEKAEGWKERVAEFQEEYDEHLELILSFNENSFFQDRFDLIRRILKDNGYKDNELLMSDKFWDEMVEPFEFANFLQTAIDKDTDDKKKAV